MHSRFLMIVIGALLAIGAMVDVAHAQLGSGWTRYSPQKRIHLDDDVKLQTFPWTSQKSVCSPACADYRFDSATDTETFRVLDSRSNRSEIRLQNEYSSGRRQFQGYVRFDAPLDDESLFQIFGSTSGATQLMIRGHRSDGGSLRGGGGTLATGVYGVERRINVIHDQGGSIKIYVNGSLKRSIVDDENVTNYHKYGCYGTLRTGAATVRWRAARFFKDGRAPVATVDDAAVIEVAADDAEDDDAIDDEEAATADEWLERADDDESAASDDPAAADDSAGCRASPSGAAPGAIGGLVLALGLIIRRRRPRASAPVRRR
jgi:hypothetical protein